MDVTGIMSRTDLYYRGKTYVGNSTRENSTSENSAGANSTGGNSAGTNNCDVVNEVRTTKDVVTDHLLATAEKQKEEPVVRGSWYTDHKDGLGKVPYAAREKNGVIEYNGVIFGCDEQHNAITLGDTSDSKNILTVPLENGGSLVVNRDNLGQLADAIGMFSPEDVNRILRAIAADNKARQMEQELEEDKSSLGDSADAAMEQRDSEMTVSSADGGAEKAESTEKTEATEKTESGDADSGFSVTMQPSTLQEAQEGKEAEQEDADALEWDKNPVTQEQINRLFENRDEK